MLGKRATTSIIIENYQPKGVLQFSGMSSLIPPSKRPSLDSKLLIDQNIYSEKYLSTQSTLLTSPHTP